MLADKQVRELIDSTFDVLMQAVSYDTSVETQQELEQATYRFSGFKTFHEMNEAAFKIHREQGEVVSFSDYRNAVKAIDDKYNENYLKTEYNLFTQSALSAEKWNEFSQNDRYNLRYVTAGDDKVREEHAILDGTVLPVDDTFWDSYYPPNGYGCRCDVIQVRKSKYELSDSSAAIAIGNKMTEGKAIMWRFNPGKTKTPYPPKHPYMPTGCGDCDKVKLARGSNKISCSACQVTNKSYLKKLDIDILKWFKDKNRKIVCVNVKTGMLSFTNNEINGFLAHANQSSLKKQLLRLYMSPEEIHYIETNILGLNKDLNNPKDIANLKRKRERGVIEYTKYDFGDYVIGCENINDKYETPYYIYKKKKAK